MNSKDVYKTWVEISENAVKHNIAEFKKIIGPKTKLMAVIKSNAYGHGLLEFSKLADKFGINWFGADALSEALKLRKRGIKKPILVLGYTRNCRFKEAAENNISVTIYNTSDLYYCLKNKKYFKKNPLKIHLKIDTGMHRQGIYPENLPAFLKELKKNPALIIAGIYTHFASAKDIADSHYTKKQLEKFKKAVKILESAGIKNAIKHAAATGAAVLYPESRFDMVRIGIGLYGLWPSKEAELQHNQIVGRQIHLKPVLTWKTIVAQVKNAKKGGFIGYDLSEQIFKDSKIAILPIGYWHGYDRGFSGIADILINGKRCKVLGRVSMDMTVVNATNAGKIKIENEAVLLGKRGDNEITADELAQKIETTPYEIVTRVNPQIPRMVV